MALYHRWLLLILALYLGLVSAYAWLTPIWQAPDEPAHFNNIVTLGSTGHLAQLRTGDYNQAYLETLKARHFPPELSIASVRYEGHQPPLYYGLMVPVWLVVRHAPLTTQVHILRWVNGLIGLMGLGLLWLTARRLFPARPQIGVLAVGFAAFLPMHVAMNGAINNDALAEGMILAVVWRLLGHVQEEQSTLRAWGLTGLLIGLALLTKFQTYFLVPLAGGVWAWQTWRSREALWQGLKGGLALFLPMLLLPLPWWLRNMSLYGPLDPLGLRRHAMVVTGQPRTQAWIAREGWGPYLHRLITFTFQSFWGVFGWMGAFMDARAYMALTLFSVLILAGLSWQLWRSKAWRLLPWQRRGILLLAVQWAAVVAAYVWYNLSFVQHQGRYLFPALGPWSLGVGIGLLAAFSAGGRRWALAAVAAVGLWWLGIGLWHGEVNKWGLLETGAMLALLVASRLLPRISPFAWGLMLEGGLFLLALYALWGVVIPML